MYYKMETLNGTNPRTKVKKRAVKPSTKIKQTKKKRGQKNSPKRTWLPRKMAPATS
jgi:hypothetical protein